MIREMQEKDLDTVMHIWLEENSKAHSFIRTDYWKEHFDVVRAVLPLAEVYVYEEKETIDGFIGLNNKYIEGIFVRGNSQSKGIGTALLNYAKGLKPMLVLNVYKKNARAVAFYKNNTFQILAENREEATGEVEYTMQWKGKIEC